MEKYIARPAAVAARGLADEMIVLSVPDSMLFNLNSVATVIWKAADGKTSLREIVLNCVCKEYDVDPELAYRDAEQIVDELAKYRILLVSESPIPEASKTQEP